MRTRRRLFTVIEIAFLFLLTTTKLSAQKVDIGYDKSADFSQFKTYSWVPRTVPPTNPLLATMINNNIEYELQQKGLHKVESDPDLLVKSYGGAEDVKGGF